ncbi:allophanate hydrolase subunit 1 [Prauserella oleivorans]|uniref:Allophanate hydrolase subunit 1 n=1 Tax=Prauserella oleivorans TaxID=1478153 RepID=A0ABW5WGW1_9PSEU
MSVVLDRTPAVEGRPAATYRQAGEEYVLVEYADGTELDLRLNFVVVGMLGALTTAPPPGFVEAAPGLRSILIRYDPAATSREALLHHLRDLHGRQPEIAGLTVPSRRIVLPIAFDDSATAEAVRRYVTTIRPDAPYARDGTNIDYIAEQNGLADREELYEAILGTEWWTAFTGFAPGLPFLFSLREPTLSVPKYNPTRAWTPEGAVGIGGPCVAIYPVDSPGSYQLFGRTVPIYDLLGRHELFRDDPFLIRAGDRVRFTRVTEEELLRARRQAFDGRYAYRVEDAPFVVADYLAGR